MNNAFKCADNDNLIRIVRSEEEKDWEIHFSNPLGKEWLVFSIKDVVNAMKDSVLKGFDSILKSNN